MDVMDEMNLARFEFKVNFARISHDIAQSTHPTPPGILS